MTSFARSRSGARPGHPAFRGTTSKYSEKM
ncbi:phage DNA packaging protein J [uncultured Alistipes sp.]